MKPRMAPALAAAALLLALAGCGGSDGDDGGAAPQGDPEIAAAAVLVAGDLPSGSRERRAAVLRQDADHGDPCGPLPILRQAGRPPALSPMIVAGGVDVRQTIGVFASPAQARQAFAALGSPRRRDCIVAALSELGGTFADRPPVTPLPPIDLDYGNEAELLRFVINRPDPSVQQFVDTVAVRVGRTVSASVLLSAEPSAIDQRVRDATIAAVSRMESAQG